MFLLPKCVQSWIFVIILISSDKDKFSFRFISLNTKQLLSKAEKETMLVSGSKSIKVFSKEVRAL